jgi:hypothetical protein
MNNYADNTYMIKYHPCSKEFQEEAKRLGLTGNQLIQKYIQEEKLPNPTDVDRDSNNRIYQNFGYKDKAEYLRNWRHSNGIQFPMEENTDCAHYLGTLVAERQYGRIILPEMFGGIVKEMPYGNPSFDFLVKGNIKVDVKSCCLREIKGWHGWEPHVRFNNVTDYFIILAFDDRDNLNLIYVWLIGKNEIIRDNKFYMRDGIKITNTRRGVLEFKRFDWTDKLECLKQRS